MTFYPSESVIQELARKAREAAKEIASRKLPAIHPEEFNAPIEYRLRKEDYRVFMELTAAYIRADETHRPAAERYDQLKHALRQWEAARKDATDIF